VARRGNPPGLLEGLPGLPLSLSVTANDITNGFRDLQLTVPPAGQKMQVLLITAPVLFSNLPNKT